MRVACWMILASVAAFALLIGTAMAVYPGGTWHDPKRPGHHFWFNYLCDLLRAQGLDGRPNALGARLATGGMLALVVAAASYFVVAPQLLAHWPVVAQVVRVLGLIAAAGLVGVALLPSDRFGHLHTVALVSAAGPGLVACTLAIAGAAWNPEIALWLRGLGVLVWASLVATFAVYARHTWFGGGWERLLPTLQRLAVIFALIWLAGSAMQVLARLPGLNGSIG